MEDLRLAVEEGSQNDSRMDKVVDSWTYYLHKAVNKCNLGAKLVFIPMQHDGHYFCVCINFFEMKISVLHSRLYTESEWHNSEVYKLSRLVANAMSDFLESSRPDASDVTRYDVIQETFSWQKNDNNAKESGLFLLMYMLCFEGESFEMASLEKKISRRSVVLEIAATILLADINHDRDKLLANVEKFITDKPVFWKNLDAKRKLNAIVVKKGLNVNETTEQAIVTEVPVLRIKTDDARGRGRGRAQSRGRGRGKV